VRISVVVLCIIGAILVAAGAVPLYNNWGAMELTDLLKGLLGVLLGLGLGTVGLIIHLVDSLLRLLRHRDSLVVRVSLRVLGVELLVREVGEDTDYETLLEEVAPADWVEDW
jgi:putative exporter of polyketide antibiotics